MCYTPLFCSAAIIYIFFFLRKKRSKHHTSLQACTHLHNGNFCPLTLHAFSILTHYISHLHVSLQKNRLFVTKKIRHKKVQFRHKWWICTRHMIARYKKFVSGPKPSRIVFMTDFVTDLCVTQIIVSHILIICDNLFVSIWNRHQKYLWWISVWHK